MLPDILPDLLEVLCPLHPLLLVHGEERDGHGYSRIVLQDVRTISADTLHKQLAQLEHLNFVSNTKIST